MRKLIALIFVGALVAACNMTAMPDCKDVKDPKSVEQGSLFGSKVYACNGEWTG